MWQLLATLFFCSSKGAENLPPGGESSMLFPAQCCISVLCCGVSSPLAMGWSNAPPSPTPGSVGSCRGRGQGCGFGGQLAPELLVLAHCPDQQNEVTAEVSVAALSLLCLLALCHLTAGARRELNQQKNIVVVMVLIWLRASLVLLTRHLGTVCPPVQGRQWGCWESTKGIPV